MAIPTATLKKRKYRQAYFLRIVIPVQVRKDEYLLVPDRDEGAAFVFAVFEIAKLTLVDCKATSLGNALCQILTSVHRKESHGCQKAPLAMFRIDVRQAGD